MIAENGEEYHKDNDDSVLNIENRVPSPWLSWSIVSPKFPINFNAGPDRQASLL